MKVIEAMLKDRRNQMGMIQARQWQERKTYVESQLLALFQLANLREMPPLTTDGAYQDGVQFEFWAVKHSARYEFSLWESREVLGAQHLRVRTPSGVFSYTYKDGAVHSDHWGWHAVTDLQYAFLELFAEKEE